ncbi:MAG TPA: hypothetical protein QF480_03065 [Bacteroidales bacterium]|nr:hypothetical protein [Bacteroidales bacterium]|tara:strand:+ start:163 stop:444 length:282 start_codon:yes stop_codon:yes gene_type:complete
MRLTRIKTWILLGMIVFIVTSCAPGSANFTVEQAGFFMGLWHGFISLFTFIISLFSDSVEIYEANNNGGWYNFGFILGISIFYGGSSKGTCRR